MRFLIVLCLSLLCCSCSDNSVYDNYKTVSGQWSSKEPLTFKISGLDTMQPYNAFINLRNTSDYKFSNLFLITELQYPNGKKVTDTLEYPMAYPDGTYMGDGFGDIKENKLWYKEHLVFNEAGEYSISIKHAMRQNGSVAGLETLKGITEVGVRIEKPTSK